MGDRGQESVTQVSAQEERLRNQYVALRLADWLSDPGFEGLRCTEDAGAEVYRREEGRLCRVRVHVASEGLTSQTLAAALARCDGFGALELAAPQVAPEVRALLEARTPDDAWRSTLRATGLSSELGERLHALRPRLDVLDTEHTPELYRGIALRLARLPTCEGRSAEQLVDVARELATLAAAASGALRPRAVLLAQIEGLMLRFARPAPRQLVHLWHDTFGGASDARPPPGLAALRRTTVALGPVLGMVPEWAGLLRALAQLTAPDGPLLGTLRARPEAAVLYTGAAHAPLALLAGYAVGPDVLVRLGTPEPKGRTQEAARLAVRAVRVRRGSVVRARVAFGTALLASACAVAAPSAGLDLELALETPGPPHLTETALREAACQVRSALEWHARAAREIHLFVAAPTGLAFILGQALRGSGLGPMLVHAAPASGPCAWRIHLQNALARRPHALRACTPLPPLPNFA